MTTLITSTTLTSGYQLLADSTGTLVIQTGSTPTTAMTINASQNVGIGTTVMNVFDAVAVNRPLVVARSDTSTSNIGSAASITISNLDTTTNNVSQINFAAITGANTNHFSSAIISAIHGARTNGQYPTGILTFSTSTALNNAPSEKMRIDNAGRFTLNSQPFFYATLTVAQTGYNSQSTGDVVVVYNATTTNTGSHFNTSTGKFTAPVAGNYIFHASAYSAASTFQQNWLVVNGSRKTGTDWVHASSAMSIGFWLIKLAANDTVGFHAYNGSVTSATINTNSEHTYFRGYLLS